MKKKETLAYFSQREHWIQIDDNGEYVGEPVEFDVLIKKTQESRSNFYITYLTEVVRMIDVIGNKKMKVIKYVLQNMDSNNILVKTIRQIAADLKVSRNTVNDALLLLEKTGFIARQAGLIMLSPRIAHKGNVKKERFLLTKFYDIHNQGYKKDVPPPEENSSEES